MNQSNTNAAPQWLWGSAVLAGLLLYPALMQLFVLSCEHLSEQHDWISLMLFLVGLLAIFSHSLVGFWLLVQTKLDAQRCVTQRCWLHLLVCVPVLFTLAKVAAYLGAFSHVFLPVWCCAIGLLFFAALLVKSQERICKPKRLRIVHGLLALTFIVGFLLLHWINHTAALLNPAFHGIVQQFLRMGYRATWLEPLLIAVCSCLVCSGFYLAFQHVRCSSDKYKRLQTVTGSYLGLFLATHLLAVFSARLNGIDTNWGFATGGQGLLFNFQFLIPYYALALCCFTLHAAVALRQILIAHKFEECTVGRAFKFVSGMGFLFSGLIMTAALGVSIL